MFKKILTILILGNTILNQDHCNVAYNQYSQCQSSTTLTGIKYQYIQYSFNVSQNTSIYCQAYGMGFYGPHTDCKWGWWNLGLVNNKSFTLIWDNFQMNPVISCFGKPTGSMVTWYWSSGVGNYSCLRGDKVLEKSLVRSKKENIFNILVNNIKDGVEGNVTKVLED